MKNAVMLKIITLGCTILFAIGCCKKEKCPKLTEAQKNTMGYSGEELLPFLVNDYVNKITDTVTCRVQKIVRERNIPCSNPDAAGECDILFSLIFYNNYYGVGDATRGYSIHFSPLYALRNYDDGNGKIISNYTHHSELSTVELNGKMYFNVQVDSIQKYDVDNRYNYLLFSENQVLYWTQKDGLLSAKMYVNDSLNIELINLK